MKRLVRNIGIFAIGNLGSKVIGFLLIAIFTRYLTTTQFGYVDLITTTVNMLLPIIALSIADAVFRFVMDDDANDQMIFSTGVNFSLMMSLIVFLIAFPILKLFDVHYAGLVLLYLSALSQIMYYAWLYLILFLLKEPFKQLLDGRTECSIYLLFLLSYILVQTLFEPDLGSCLRHQIIFFPVIFYLSERNQEKKRLYE